MTKPEPQDEALVIEQRDRDAADLLKYLDACHDESKPCPHCETWALSDCLAGRGCPTPDGLNGASYRTTLRSSPDAV